MAFVKLHLPCDACGSKDALSVNENGSSKCFSCGDFIKNYNKEDSSMELVKNKNTSLDNKHGAIYGALNDRKISKDTATKYGVKAVYNSDGEVVQHIYPFYNNNEQTASKIRYVKDKNFSFQGTYEGTGLFGEQLFKGGKYITLVEGECDAMAGYELFRIFRTI